MNTAAQNSPGQPSAADPLLAEAIALTLHDYREALAEIAAAPVTGEARVQAERIRPEIQSDPRLAPLTEARPEFVDWAVQKAASDRDMQVSEVSADEAREALHEPRRKLVRNLLGALSRNAPKRPGSLGSTTQDTIDEPGASEGDDGTITAPGIDQLYLPLTGSALTSQA